MIISPGPRPLYKSLFVSLRERILTQNGPCTTKKFTKGSKRNEICFFLFREGGNRLHIVYLLQKLVYLIYCCTWVNMSPAVWSPAQIKKTTGFCPSIVQQLNHWTRIVAQFQLYPLTDKIHSNSWFQNYQLWPQCLYFNSLFINQNLLIYFK